MTDCGFKTSLPANGHFEGGAPDAEGVIYSRMLVTALPSEQWLA